MTIQAYQPKMTELQLAFFQALTAPFPDESLSEKPGRGKDGKPLTWLDKRALENRLDSVCTPLGWTIEYRPTNRGFIGRMGILCPTDGEEWIWIYKEDGAGYEEMNTVDDDEKSGYTNTLRRVAQDAWGIGRYLYRKGLPSFADPNAQARPELPPYVAPEAALPPAEKYVAPAPEPEPPGRFNSPAPTPPPPVQAAPTPAPQPAPQPPSSGIDPILLKIPAAGRPMFGWVKGIEDFYQTTIKNGVIIDAEKLGGGKFMNQWSQEIVDQVAMNAIRHVRTLDQYAGEFEFMFKEEVSGNAPPLPSTNGATSTALPAPSTTGSVASSAPPAQPPTDMTAIVEGRSRCAAALTAYLIEVQGIEKPTPAILKNYLTQMSPDVANGQGGRGEVMHSLAACTDLAWIENLITLIIGEVETFRKQRDAKSASAVSPDIPF